MCLTARGKRKEAAGYMDRLSKVGEKAPMAILARMVFRYFQGDVDGAASAGLELGERYPDWDSALAVRVAGFMLAGETAKTEAAARQLLGQPRHGFVDAFARVLLGHAVMQQGRLDEAEVICREALKSYPQLPQVHEMHCFLLLRRGRFVEAQAAWRRAQQTYSKNAPWAVLIPTRQIAIDWCIGLAEQVEALAAGKLRPASWSVLSLAEVALLKGRPRQSLALYREWSDGVPLLMTHWPSQICQDECVTHQTNVARAAALIVTRTGIDVKEVGDAEVADARAEALRRLRSELTAQTSLTRFPRRHADIRRWALFCKGCTDFAALRTPEALARLPEPERRDWQQLWADVEVLYQRAHAPAARQEKAK
jgi:tetratricopeptide (TPR) repeat protein